MVSQQFIVGQQLKKLKRKSQRERVKESLLEKEN
jgi:hypothetical protein